MKCFIFDSQTKGQCVISHPSAESQAIEPFVYLHLFVTAVTLILHSSQRIQPLACVKSLFLLNEK